jgi:hypothetical protein
VRENGKSPMYQCSMYRIRRKIGTVRPAYSAEIIDRYLTKRRLVSQRFKHFSKQPVGEIDRPVNAILEFNFEAMICQWRDASDAVQHRRLLRWRNIDEPPMLLSPLPIFLQFRSVAACPAKYISHHALR